MNNEEKNTNPSALRFIAAIFGIGSVIDAACAAIFGYESPLLGVFFLGSSIIVALVALVLGIISKSALARRFSYVAVGIAVILTLVGIVALFVDKNFEDRCVEDWREFSKKTDAIERRIDRLEDRFDNN